MRYKITESELRLAVKKSLSIAGVCRELNIIAAGGNYKTLKSKFKEFNIDTSHFTGAAWNQGERYRPVNKKMDLIDVLIKNSPFKSTTHLKKRLFEENLKEKECEKCGLIKWNGKEITLEMDHINSDNTDNRLENLRILCPNCHSQTPNFRGRNKKKKNKLED